MGSRSRRFGASSAYIAAYTTAWLAMGCSGAIDDDSESGGTSGRSAPMRPSAAGPTGQPVAGLGGSTGPGVGGIPTAGAPDPLQPKAKPVSACIKPGPVAGPAPLARLSNVEYRNTLRDLFPRLAIGGQTLELPAEVATQGFFNNASAQVASANLVDDYRTNAQAIARAAVTDLTKVLPCRASNPAEEASCGRQFIETFGKQVNRRPLSTDELGRYGKAFTDLSAKWGFATGIRLIVEAFLQSPQFLYRIEPGKAGLPAAGAVPLEPFELASRLSYFLTDTMPDPDLMLAAETGKLATVAGVESEARRVLADVRSRAAIAAFHAQWLRFDAMDKLVKSPDLFPKFNAALAQSLKESAVKYVDMMFWDTGRTLSALLSDDSAFVNDKLAPLYGITATGTALVSAKVDPTQRSGILTQAGLLAGLAHERNSAPILRGVFVLDRLVCAAPPAPPPGIDTAVPEVKPGTKLTTRQQLEQSHAAATCAACHRAIDGLGFGFENYDALGQWRTKEVGLDVSAKGELVGTQDADGPFTGAVELGRKLASSPRVQQCVSSQWLGYSFGVGRDEIDACTVESVGNAFQVAKGDLRELLVAVVKSEAFRHRPTLVP